MDLRGEAAWAVLLTTSPGGRGALALASLQLLDKPGITPTLVSQVIAHDPSNFPKQFTVQFCNIYHHFLKEDVSLTAPCTDVCSAPSCMRLSSLWLPGHCCSFCLKPSEANCTVALPTINVS